MKKNNKLLTLVVWGGLLLLLFALFMNAGPRPRRGPPHRAPSDFHESAGSGPVNRVPIDRETGDGTFHPDSERAFSLPSLAGAVLPFLVIALVLVIAFRYLVRKAGGQATGIFAFGKSRARLVTEKTGVTFADVGGCEEAKEELADIIDYLRRPEAWETSGARLPRGVLLVGPPGCGKTHLARAVAGEADASFFVSSASEFIEFFVGTGAARVRDLFEKAAARSPSIVFIDEIDSIGRWRGSGIGGGHDEREQTLNQLLACMDGFRNTDRIVVMAATNRPDVLDGALLRPGRFDRRIAIPELGRDPRLEVLRIHTRAKPMHPGIALDEIADRTGGFKGADLEALANEAALLAARRSCRNGGEAPVITEDDFARALASFESRREGFSKLDALLIESASQFSRPTGRARVRLVLRDGTVLEGEPVWANPTLLKIRTGDGAPETIVSRADLRRIDELEGTEAAAVGDLAPDPWAGYLPDVK